MTDLARIVAVVDRLCQQHLPTPARTAGRPSVHPTTLILQLVAVQYLHGFTSEAAFFRWLARQHDLPWPTLPSRSQYNRRVKQLPAVVASLLSHMTEQLQLDRERLRVIDSTPVPVIGYARAHRSPRFVRGDEVNYGYCPARNLRYFGAKLHLVTSKAGIPITYILGPANRHDVQQLVALGERLPRRTWLVGDMGYQSRWRQRHLRDACGITVFTPAKKNQPARSAWVRRLLQKRRCVIDSTFAQCKDHLGLERLGAKSYAGIEGRVAALLFTYDAGVLFNQRYHRPYRAIKSILL